MNDVECPECGWTGELTKENGRCPECGNECFDNLSGDLEGLFDGDELEEGFGTDLEDINNDLFEDEDF